MRRAGSQTEPHPISARRRAAIVALSALGTLFVLLVWNDFRDTWFSAGYGKITAIALSIYWGLWAVWPALAWLAWKAAAAWRARRTAACTAFVLALLLGSALAWARFIEPWHLGVRETTLGRQCGSQVALISDIHMGLYMREPDLKRIVERLNALPIDAVLVAGDWTHLPPHDLVRTFAPLAQLKHPVIGVLGNHDEQMPGPPITEELREALAASKVRLIDGQRVPLGRCTLIGIGDLYAGSAETHLQHLRLDPPAEPTERRVMLTHNPDVATRMAPGTASIVLAGHTHGGQVYLPLLTQLMLRRNTRGAFEQGLYELPHTRLYVTPGVGIDLLPLRFLVPPTIDVLSL